MSVLSLIAAVLVLHCHHHAGQRSLPGWLKFLLRLSKRAEITPSEEKPIINEEKLGKIIDAKEKCDNVYSEMNETLKQILQELQNQRKSGKEIEEGKFKNEWQLAAKRLDLVFFNLFLLVLFILNIWFIAVMMTA